MASDVTVLSVFYNRAGGVAASMQSLRDQDCDSFRAIVMDDGSNDDTFQRLKTYASDSITVRRQRNTGFTQTMRQLCEQADTEFIAVHGAGDESFPMRLSMQRDFLRAHPAVVAVGCGIENVDEVTGRRWPVMPRETLKRGPICSQFGISHGEVMLRRDAYMAAGGYRVGFPVGQATDLFRRMSRLGDFGYVPEILYRRYLRHDGINAQIDRIAERDVLDALSSSVQQSAIRQGGQGMNGSLQDDIDRYGLLLPYFGTPSRDIATSLARAAVKLWVAGDRTLALRIARRSLAEYRTGQGILSYLAIIGGVGPMRDPIQQWIMRHSSAVAELDLARLHAAQPKTHAARKSEWTKAMGPESP